MQPFKDAKYPPEIKNIGIALSVDQNPRYGQISPYWGAVNAVVESVRNVSAVGATPQAMTDSCIYLQESRKDPLDRRLILLDGENLLDPGRLNFLNPQ